MGRAASDGSAAIAFQNYLRRRAAGMSESANLDAAASDLITIAEADENQALADRRAAFEALRKHEIITSIEREEASRLLIEP